MNREVQNSPKLRFVRGREDWVRFAKRCGRRFLPLLLRRLSKADTGSATVLIDELGAGSGVLCFPMLTEESEIFVSQKTVAGVLTSSASAASEPVAAACD